MLVRGAFVGDGYIGIDNAHGVRLDVYAVDAMRNMYDIEMQTYSITNLGKRIRFYHSQMDNEQISTGETYDRLRKNICNLLLLLWGSV